MCSSLPAPDIFTMFFFIKFSSGFFRSETHFFTQSYDLCELIEMLGKASDPGRTQRDWKLLRDK